MNDADISPTILVKFADIVGAPAPAVRLILSILLGFPFALVHRYALYGKNPALQHVYFIICGLILGYWNYEWDIVHSAAASCGTYLILKVFGSTGFSVIAIFIFNMVYLLYGYFTTSTNDYDFKWTMPHCVLTLRLIGLGFDVFDSPKPIEKLSETQRTKILPGIPSILEVFSYTFFPGSFLVGPQFSLRRYLDYVNGTLIDDDLKKGSREPPDCLKFGIQRALVGFVYVALFQLGSLYFTDEYLLTVQFQKGSFIRKIVYISLWAHVVLYKYISCWLMTEGVCIAFGLTYNGKDSLNQSQWNGCENVELATFESATCLNDYIMSFNINTNHWCAEYIYKRLKFLGSRVLSQLFTLVFLAIWHGIHSGYYMCFFMEFVLMYFEKDMGPVLAKHKRLQSILNKNLLTRLIKTIILRAYAYFFMAYGLIGFFLLSRNKYLPVYGSIYYCGHVIFILYPIFAPLVKSIVRLTDYKKHDE